MKTLFWLWIAYGHSGSFFPQPFQDARDCEDAYAQIVKAKPALDDSSLWKAGAHTCIAVSSVKP